MLTIRADVIRMAHGTRMCSRLVSHTGCHLLSIYPCDPRHALHLKMATPKSPLVELPTEIHLLIIRDLFFRDKISLQMTCTYFHGIIPPLNLGDLLEAETSDYAMRKDLYACRYCLRLLPAYEFADKMLRRRRSKHGPDAHKRFCVGCGLKPRDGDARYGPGARITVQGTTHIICRLCREFHRNVSHRARFTCICEHCWCAERERQRQREQQEIQPIKYAVCDLDR